MFGSSSSFGQSSGSPFGSQSPFGQNNANPFGSQTGGSVFGNTSTGVPGQSSPLSSTPAFGAASLPAFGSSAFGQTPFGGFGSGAQTSPFGSSFQQSQPAFGSNTFGSTAPFGASSQPSFGGTSTSAFGSSTTPSFGSTSTTGFGPTSTPAFGSTPSPAFGSTGTAFGVGSTPAFGSAGAFGSANPSPAFGAATTSAFGTTSTPSFGSTSTPAFGAATTPSFNFNSSPAFGQSTSAFGSPGFGSAPFGTQGSSGAQTTTSTFGTGAFGQSNQGGSRVSSYQATADIDGPSNQSQGKLESISAMQIYKDKSHEELRWEDYQRGDKGGRNAAGQSTSVLSSGVTTAAPNPFGSPQTFGQPAANPFSSSTQTNTFTPTPSPFGSTGFGTTTPSFGSSPFSSAPATTPSLFGSNPAQTPSPFGTSTPSFASSPSIFGATSSSATGSPSLFGPTQGQGQSLFGNSTFGSQSSPLFQSSSPSLGIGSSLGQTSSLFGSSSTFTNAFSTTSNTFSTSGFSNTSFGTGGQLGFSQSAPSHATPFQPSLPSQTNSLFNFSNAGQTQAGGASSIFGQSLGQSFGNQSSAALQPVAITNPFGTLPAMPHMSVGNTGTSPSIQYGISSMPVVDKPTPVRVSSLLTSRHLSQRRIRLPARKYHPKNDGSRVAFFTDEDEAPSTPKADALFIPRENPRALIIRPIDQRLKSSTKEPSALVCENGKVSMEKQHHLNGYTAQENNGIANGNGLIKDHQNSVRICHKLTGNSDNDNGADIEAAVPKLHHSDYYTEPQIQELAAKERAEPGYCRHVKDFSVGRQGFGSIKFLGETDVRGLDLETLIQFNDREVIVYMDDSHKPPVGQGLNKPAEVTLLNIKCYDRKTKNQIFEGPKLEKYKEMLKKKAEDQGAEFLSYDPAKAEWKFRVKHFSRYVFCDSHQWDF
ncbi:hypothetical protein RND81_09G002000 [Saponaria officinalis]|uniref:Nucleoporin autopeptidase n=1 Tax=Saponaria officinalis TaxID=3572 RepID=A0AAW1IGY1_SAPOF